MGGPKTALLRKLHATPCVRVRVPCARVRVRYGKRAWASIPRVEAHSSPSPGLGNASEASFGRQLIQSPEPHEPYLRVQLGAWIGLGLGLGPGLRIGLGLGLGLGLAPSFAPPFFRHTARTAPSDSSSSTAVSACDRMHTPPRLVHGARTAAARLPCAFGAYASGERPARAARCNSQHTQCQRCPRHHPAVVGPGVGAAEELARE